MAQCSSSTMHDQIRRDLERRRKVVNAAKERVARRSFASPSPRQSALISSMSNGAVTMNRANAGKEGVANKRSAPAPPLPHRPALVPRATTNAATKKIAYLELGEAPKRRPVPRTMILTSSTMKVSGIASVRIPEKSSAPPSACRTALISSISNGAVTINLANATKEAVGKKRSAPPPSLPHQSALVPLATTNAAGKKIACLELG